MLLMALRLEQNQQFDASLLNEMSRATGNCPTSNASRGYVIWEKDFPRTASMKIKRTVLAEEIGKTIDRAAMVKL